MAANDAFTLRPGEAKKWFRFTTLGDGQRGNIIRVVQGEDVGTLVGSLKPPPQQQEA